MDKKPVGTYACTSCGKIYDGSDVKQDEKLTAVVWVCPDTDCGYPVRMISRMPRNKYLETVFLSKQQQKNRR